MSDWLDEPINKKTGELADIAAQYYGDKVLTNIYGLSSSSMSQIKK